MTNHPAEDYDELAAEELLDPPSQPLPLPPTTLPMFTPEHTRSLGAFLDLARGDPRLNAWEERFLASITRGWRKAGTGIKLSEKQCGALNRLTEKLGIGTAPSVNIPATQHP